MSEGLGGWAERLYKRVIGGKDSVSSTIPALRQTTLDRTSVATEVQNIGEINFGAKDYILQASRLSFPVSKREVDGYTIFRISTPFANGELRTGIADGVTRADSDVDIVLKDGEVKGVRVLSRINKVPITSIGIPGEVMLHCDYDGKYGHLFVDLGRKDKLTKEFEFEPKYPESRFLRLLRLGGNLQSDAELKYGRQRSGEYKLFDSKNSTNVEFPQTIAKADSEQIGAKLASDTGWLELPSLLSVGFRRSEPVTH